MTDNAIASPASPGADVVLRIEDLVVDFPMAHRAPVRAVDHVSLEMRKAEILGIVGESGSGKSTMARVVAGFLEPTEGDILLPDSDGKLVPRSGKRGHRDVQMVFQQSAVSMNPRSQVWKVIGEAYSPNRWLSKGRSVADGHGPAAARAPGRCHVPSAAGIWGPNRCGAAHRAQRRGCVSTRTALAWRPFPGRIDRSTS